MDNTLFKSYAVEDRSYTSFIKREIHTAVSQTKFSPAKIGEIDIIVSELTSNLIKHAGGGELLYRLTCNNDVFVFEVICIDSGKGIENIAHMMKDGVSTTKTLGQGLGALQRLSNLFQIYSREKWGTISYSKVFSDTKKTTRENNCRLTIQALNVPKPGEEVSGDGHYVKKSRQYTSIFFGDGLGHGEQAHLAVTRAIESFQECPETDPASILRYIHDRIRKTRGVVASVAVLDHQHKTWKICGVGNIAVKLYNGLMFKSYLSYNGIIGLNIPGTMKDFELPCENNQHIIMASDGLRSRWDLTKYSTLYKYDLVVQAAILYKDFARRNDDTSILIGKITI